jgi:hypothetical protein
MESTSKGLQLRSYWNLLHVESTWSPHRLHIEWRITRMDWRWTGGGLDVDFMDYIETRGGLQEDPWGSVRYSVEWAKAKARANRWEEEVILVDEEMRRVLEFCQWKTAWWLEQVPLREGLQLQLAEGLSAYAEEQADMEWRICLSWTAKWSAARELAAPILLAAQGAAPRQEVVPGSAEMMEVDIEEEHDGTAGNSDFEE